MSVLSTVKYTLTTSAILFASGALFNLTPAQAATLNDIFLLNNSETTINLINQTIDFKNAVTNPLGEGGIPSATVRFMLWFPELI